MYADDDFWFAYADYIEESTPRHKHAVAALEACTDPPTGLHQGSVLDLGCGKHQEARTLLTPRDYIGVDTDPGDGPLVLKADYRSEWDKVVKACLLNGDESLLPSLVTSLFSTEITAPAYTNLLLYDQVFRTLPGVKHILVAGFYYTDKMSLNPVEEPGGLKSWQSLDLLAPHPAFSEARLYIPAPSKLFGPNVVEVWKLLTRSET